MELFEFVAEIADIQLRQLLVAGFKVSRPGSVSRLGGLALLYRLFRTVTGLLGGLPVRGVRSLAPGIRVTGRSPLALSI